MGTNGVWSDMLQAVKVNALRNTKGKSVTYIIEIVTYSPDEEQAYKYICEYKSTFRRGEFKSTEVECLCKELLRLMNVHLPKYSHFDCKISPNIYSGGSRRNLNEKIGPETRADDIKSDEFDRKN